MVNRIHIFGASGSGTTTLGKAVAESLQIPFLDTDTYYWKDTDPPFTEKNQPAQRIRLIREAIRGQDSWILSGSICSWGDPLLESFTLAVFLHLDPDIRMRRLAQRELHRYGGRIEPGGDMQQIHEAFMSWAQSYDSARAPTRSLHLHQLWRTQLTCPVLDLDSSVPVPDLVRCVLVALPAS